MQRSYEQIPQGDGYIRIEPRGSDRSENLSAVRVRIEDRNFVADRRLDCAGYWGRIDVPVRRDVKFRQGHLGHEQAA